MTRTLASRILLLAVGLVVATALIAGLATVQFARSAARSEQRGELTAQASLLSLQSARLVTRSALDRVAQGLGGTVVSVYGSDGALVTSTARGTPIVRRTRSIAATAIGGSTVSTSVRVAGRDVLVEARPSADGGAIVLARPLSALTRDAADLIGGILVTLGIALVLAVSAAVWLAGRITKPLAATAAAARRLADGERGVAVPTPSPAEVADVADALQSLDAALSTSEGRQREFLLSISHELRTPLTALRGYGEALSDGLVPPERTAEVGGILVAETTRLERFTADLLELARLEADDFSLEPGRIDLAQLAGSAIEAWTARAELLGVHLESDGLESPLAARGDPRRVRQVLDGLVENALRATPAGGRVLLAGARTDGAARVAVEDSGAGLSDEDLADAFTRGLLRERYRETRDVGTGLGLSIATRLAARMGGRVVAGHAATPPGARFTLELPTG
ncbi:MAG TPA: HAMP domain-containing sensor histidine kinase [Amnibacterium sp.]|jgi:two-component system sensor histidine kinase BaeS|nr:HAMP domain-containing sensor histidine kinase [Amnibacterium sp.]